MCKADGQTTAGLCDTAALVLEDGQTAHGVVSDCVVWNPSMRLMGFTVRSCINGDNIRTSTCSVEHMWNENFEATLKFA